MHITLKLALFAGLLLLASYAGEWIVSNFNPHLTPSSEETVHRTIMFAITLYVLLMMLPFVPGIEIGLGMMVMFGPKIVPLVYGGTVLALTLAFLVGRLVPQHVIIGAFDRLHLKRAGHLVRKIESLEPKDRLQFLLQNASNKLVPFLLRHRFLALIAVLNMPGNALIGGGGGICMAAGLSRLFTFPKFLGTIVIAVSPVPLMIILTNGKWISG